MGERYNPCSLITRLTPSTRSHLLHFHSVLIVPHIISNSRINLGMRSVPSWTSHFPQTLLWTFLYWDQAFIMHIFRGTFQIQTTMVLLLMMVVCVYSHMFARVSGKCMLGVNVHVSAQGSQRKLLICLLLILYLTFRDRVSHWTWNLRVWLSPQVSELLTLVCLSLKDMDLRINSHAQLLHGY